MEKDDVEVAILASPRLDECFKQPLLAAYWALVAQSAVTPVAEVVELVGG